MPVAVIIEGHTDSDGDPDRNQALSVRRALMVRDLLISVGVSADRLSVVGYGPARPAAPNDTDENRSSNRRVSLVVEPPR